MSHGLFPSTDTALCQVATDSHFEVAELLLKYGADVTRKNLVTCDMCAGPGSCCHIDAGSSIRHHCMRQFRIEV